jgi:flagellar basal-body rod modification protein FlgD
MITSPVTAASPAPTSTSATNTSTDSTSPGDASILGSNLNTFLTLLTTQLQNQDPTAPMDTNQFTQQLVEFSGVEQQINTNNKLKTLITLQTSTEAMAALPMVGKTIQYSESTAPLSNGQASFTYTLPTTAAAANLAIEDAGGNIVYATTAATSAGAHSFVWNGQTFSGATAPDGAYSLVVQAADATGKAITATVTSSGTVDGVSVSNDVPTFDVGGIAVPMSELLTVQPSSN